MSAPDEQNPFDFGSASPPPDHPRRQPPRKSRLPFRLSTAREIGLALLSLAGAVIVIVLIREALGHGERLAFNGGEVFYTSGVTKDEATRLGTYLVREGYFDGDLLC